MLHLSIKVLNALYRLGTKHPLMYLSISIGFLSLGFLFILSGPVLLFYGGWSLFRILDSGHVANHLAELPVTVMFLLVGLWLSIRFLGNKPAAPEGMDADLNKLPYFKQAIDEVLRKYPNFKVDEYIFSCDSSIKLIKTPTAGLPLSCRNTLVFGIPVLLSYGNSEFSTLLERKIIQHTRPDNRFFNVTAHFYCIWESYARALLAHPGWDARLLGRLFSNYAFANKLVSAYAVKHNELLADELSVEHVNAEELARAVQLDHVVRRFMNVYFWSKVQHNPSLFSLKEVAAILPKAAEIASQKRWIQAMMDEADKPVGRPALSHRIGKIGYSKSLRLLPPEATVAQNFLSDDIDRIICYLDNKRIADMTRKLETVTVTGRNESPSVHGSVSGHVSHTVSH